jgi:hypothetical protein
MMNLVARLARAFEDARVDLMVLKGAALNLTIYANPNDRPMQDLDLLVKPEDASAACKILESLGCLRTDVMVREDFFPRFHYEVGYKSGDVSPVKLDLHVRPFRPLRYSRTVPVEALWSDAQVVNIGPTRVFIPSPGGMLIHLATHAAVHGNIRRLWLEDIVRWVEAFGDDINWSTFIDQTVAWQLVLPVRQALRWTREACGLEVPAGVVDRLNSAAVSWRDHLALWHAPRDGDHPAGHVGVNVMCTPGVRFAFEYLKAVMVPGRGHMSEWYSRRHWAWLPCAHLFRWLAPLARRCPGMWRWLHRVEVRKSGIHGQGVVATRPMGEGNVIGRFSGRRVDHKGTYYAYSEQREGETCDYEITGPLKFLNHSCRANAEFHGKSLVALRSIRDGEEVTIDYGVQACECRPHGSSADLVEATS